MAKKETCSLSKEEIEKGYSDGMYKEPETCLKDQIEKMIEPPPGGFLGRAKGWER